MELLFDPRIKHNCGNVEEYGTNTLTKNVEKNRIIIGNMA